MLLSVEDRTLDVGIRRSRVLVAAASAAGRGCDLVVATADGL